MRMFKETTTGKEEEGICPNCRGEEGLDYRGSVIDENGLHYPWSCRQCGAEGKEHYIVEFDRHEVLK